MLNNVDLFNECLKHPVKNIDLVARETLNKVILPFDDTVPTELLKRHSKLLELITSYDNYRRNNDTTYMVEIILKIDDCLKFEGMNYCPFSQYFMVHDVTYDMYLNKLNIEEKEYILDCYLEDRHQLYLNRNYSDIVFQVLTDSYSHKRKGAMGVVKLRKICSEFNIPKINDISQIKYDLYYILPDAGDAELFNKIIDIEHIKFEFKTTHQGKMPDALIKIGNNFLIVEHKILKESGGGQDKQMTEIIDFIGWRERGVYYISFMAGIYFNELINPRETIKLYKDKQNIYSNLSNCPSNYFVNEFGFNKIISYILGIRK